MIAGIASIIDELEGRLFPPSLEKKIKNAKKVLEIPDNTPEGNICRETASKFRQLAKQWHPDKVGTAKRVEAQQKFFQLGGAKDFLWKNYKCDENPSRRATSRKPISLLTS